MEGLVVRMDCHRVATVTPCVLRLQSPVSSNAMQCVAQLLPKKIVHVGETRSCAGFRIPRQGLEIENGVESSERFGAAPHDVQFHPLHVNLHEVELGKAALASEIIDRNDLDLVTALSAH